jgi:hypothetical protein
MAAINAAAQNRITGIMKKIPLHSSERLILLSIDRYLLSIDQYTAAIYLMRSMTFLPHPGQGQPVMQPLLDGAQGVARLSSAVSRGARVSRLGAPNATHTFNGLSSQLQMNVGSMA